MVSKLPPEEMEKRAKQAFDILAKDIEQSGAKIGRMEKMIMKSFGDMMEMAFSMDPKNTAKYAEKIFDMMGYVLGYSDAPTETTA